MEKILDQLIKSVDELKSRVTKLEAIVNTSQKEQRKEKQEKKLSVKEFLRSKKLKSDVQKTLALGYYLENHEQMLSFNVDDLRKGFNAAKESKPSNIHAFINQNIINGNIMEYGEKKNNKKAFVLTSSGESFVEDDLNRREK